MPDANPEDVLRWNPWITEDLEVGHA